MVSEDSKIGITLKQSSAKINKSYDQTKAHNSSKSRRCWGLNAIQLLAAVEQDGKKYHQKL